MSTSKTTQKISAEDIEAKLRALQGDVQDKVEDKKSTMLAVAGVGAILLVIAFYLLGRRSGRRRSTMVEIRRV